MPPKRKGGRGRSATPSQPPPPQDDDEDINIEATPVTDKPSKRQGLRRRAATPSRPLFSQDEAEDSPVEAKKAITKAPTRRNTRGRSATPLDQLAPDDNGGDYAIEATGVSNMPATRKRGRRRAATPSIPPLQDDEADISVEAITATDTPRKREELRGRPASPSRLPSEDNHEDSAVEATKVSNMPATRKSGHRRSAIPSISPHKNDDNGDDNDIEDEDSAQNRPTESEMSPVEAPAMETQDNVPKVPKASNWLPEQARMLPVVHTQQQRKQDQQDRATSGEHVKSDGSGPTNEGPSIYQNLRTVIKDTKTLVTSIVSLRAAVAGTLLLIFLVAFVTGKHIMTVSLHPISSACEATAGHHYCPEICGPDHSTAPIEPFADFVTAVHNFEELHKETTFLMTTIEALEGHEALAAAHWFSWTPRPQQEPPTGQMLAQWVIAARETYNLLVSSIDETNRIASTSVPGASRRIVDIVQAAQERLPNHIKRFLQRFLPYWNFSKEDIRQLRSELSLLEPRTTHLESRLQNVTLKLGQVHTLTQQIDQAYTYHIPYLEAELRRPKRTIWHYGLNYEWQYDYEFRLTIARQKLELLAKARPNFNANWTISCQRMLDGIKATEAARQKADGILERYSASRGSFEIAFPQAQREALLDSLQRLEVAGRSEKTNAL